MPAPVVFRLRYRPLWLTVGYGLIVLIIYLSLTSDPVSFDIDLPYTDKLEHMLAYFTLTAWFVQLYQLLAFSCILRGAISLAGRSRSPQWACGWSSYRASNRSAMPKLPTWSRTSPVSAWGTRCR